MSDLYVTLNISDKGEGLVGERKYPLMKINYSVIAHQEDCGRGEFSGGNETERINAIVVDGHYVINVKNTLAQFRIERVRVADVSDLVAASQRMHQEAAKTARETASKLGEKFKDLTLPTRVR